MQLSMSMLSWFLRRFGPECHIAEDEMGIRGLRFLLEADPTLNPDYVYFGEASNYIEDEKYAGTHLLVHNKSMLFFKDCDNNELLNALWDAFDFFNSWEMRLVEQAERNEPLQSIFATIETVFENPLVIGSIDNTIIIGSDLSKHKVDPLWMTVKDSGSSGHIALSDPLINAEDGQPIHKLSTLPKLVVNLYPGGSPVIMLLLQQEDETVGVFSILQEFEDLTTMNMQLSRFVARYVVQAREFTTLTALRTGSSLLNDLLEGDSADEEVSEKIKSELPGPWRLALFKNSARADDYHKASIIGVFKKNPGLCIPIVKEDGVLALMNAARLSNQSELREVLGDTHLRRLSIGLSMPFSDLDGLSLKYRQAQFAIERSGGVAGVFKTEDFAYPYLIQLLREQDIALSLVHPALKTLEQYDEETGSELRDTLSAYLRSEKGLGQAAQALHVHLNTLKYRIKRIKELTGLSLSDADEMAYLRLSDQLEGR